MDAFLAVSHFPLGVQHDACDALTVLARVGRLRDTLFHFCGGLSIEGVVTLPVFDDSNSIDPYMPSAHGGPVNLMALLYGCLQREDCRLRHAPPILVVRVPPFVEKGEGEESIRCWLLGHGASWGDGPFDFTQCCAHPCPRSPATDLPSTGLRGTYPRG